METEVGVEGNDEGKLEETRFEKSPSSLSTTTMQLSDPVVYKLVRLEGDGRLVPATDDEVMEVEGMLNDEESETHIVADTMQAGGYISNEGSSSGMLLEFETLQGLSNSENNEVDQDKRNARLEYIEEMLQKVKEEERLRLARGSPDYSSAYVIVDSQCTDQHDKLPFIDEKIQSEIPLQETVPSSSPSMRASHMHNFGDIVECQNPPEILTESGSLISSTVASSQPDFSLLRGEICLDNLSIRELHETFKATFGRETNVKDKQWLKRRIAMGLTNSCDVSTKSFIIKDNKLVKTAKEDCTTEDVAVANDPTISTAEVIQEEAQVSPGSRLEDHQVVSDKRNYSLCYYSGSEDNQEERVAKRIRKPTKRYIEELSEVDDKEFNSRLKTFVKDAELVQIPSNAHVRAIKNVASDGRTVTTRLDSLGGSGIEIPCVSRVRRSRPRKNLMALMKFNPDDMGLAATIVQKALDAHACLSDKENGDIKMEVLSASPLSQPQVLGLADEDEQFIEVPVAVPAQHKPVKNADSSGDSDDNILTVPTSKGGIRRKHHRAWTLSEVMKLVDGVSRYGAGRWSEIKRLAFASYSYRTSVDLKDKWRNLLKASFAQVPSEKGINSRKNNATMPIPEAILLRVRELAEMQSVSIPNISLAKVVGSTGGSVHEKKSGYL
ncbi:TRF-like 6 [Euphorbia peplus]|nr:TRF-like 6 [Euphorbia peplus]